MNVLRRPALHNLAPEITPPKAQGSTIGYVKWFNDIKGFGFLTSDSAPNQDIFVHYSAIIQASGRKTLCEGDRVSFELMTAGKGPQAQNVEAL